MKMLPRLMITSLSNPLITYILRKHKIAIFVTLFGCSALLTTPFVTSASAAKLFGRLFFGDAAVANANYPESAIAKSGPAAASPVGSLVSMSLFAPQTPAMTSARRGHTATRLPDGRVLIAGGQNADGTLNQTEIYNPTTGTFSASANMNTARADHSATLLPNGHVLIAGGFNGASAVTTTEIFDSTTGTFTAGPSMNLARRSHTATLLSDGRLLIVGGDANGSAEILDAGVQSFTTISAHLDSIRVMHSAALLLDGRVLFVGGRDASGNALRKVEIYDTAGSSFSTVDSLLAVARVQPHLRVLFDGKVQIMGGNNDESMEIYDPLREAIGAYAHVLPQSDPCTNLINYVLASQTRATLFHNNQSDTVRDRSGHTITELPGSNRALIIGGQNTAGTALSSSSTLNSSPASITTDKLDYAPGETATLSGRGWAPGETVRIMIHEDPHTPQERGLDVVADANGNMTGTYLVQDYDLNMKFVVGARGLTSGWTAQTTFTDNRQIIAATVNGGSTTTVSPGQNITASVTVVTTTSGGGGEAWLSTSWTYATTPPASTFNSPCADTPDHTTVSPPTGFTESFLTNAPTTPGTYNAYFLAWRTADCGNNPSNLFVLPNAVIVTAPNTDISITKTATASPISAGDTAGFTITATNPASGTAATSVTVTDNLPSGVSWTDNSADCSINGSGLLTCNFGTIASGANKSVQVTGTTDSADCAATLSNTANVTSSNDSDTNNNSASAAIVVQCPDIKVEKTADAASISAGDTAAYTIVVSNIGLGVARGATLSDTLPAGVSWSEDSADCSIAAGALSCSFGDLAAGASRTIHVTGATDAADCGTLSNTATVAATNEAASANGNNTSSATITVLCPDVQVSKTADASSVSATDSIGFTISVNNIGLGIARSVSLTDTLPANADLSWTINGGTGAGSCVISGGALNCTFGDLASGAGKTVHITSPTTPNSCGTITNSATASATNEAVGATANNTASASVTVLCPDVTVTKIADANPVNAGNQIGFTISVTNAGPGVAKSVMLSDSLPSAAGLSWSESPDNSQCAIVGATLTCSFGDLASGASASVHVISPTTPANCGGVTNTAQVSASNEAAAQQTNNSATASITLNDVTAPTITLNGQEITLWSPNHKYTTVNVTDLVASASDSCSTSLSLSSVYISKVTSDEPENINGGDGNTVNDMIIAANCRSVQLRAERDGSKNGRVYTITFKVQDLAGNVGTVEAKVKVPKSQGSNVITVEDAPAYIVTNSACP